MLIKSTFVKFAKRPVAAVVKDGPQLFGDSLPLIKQPVQSPCSQQACDTPETEVVAFADLIHENLTDPLI